MGVTPYLTNIIHQLMMNAKGTISNTTVELKQGL